MITRLLCTLPLLMVLVDACGQADTAPASPPPYENVSVEQFRTLMDGEDVVVLDVRTPGEVSQGKIDGATELDFRDPDFRQRLEALDKDRTYLIYCAVGGRSSQTCEMMSEAGFARLYNLEGGYTAWKGQ
ncbi:rhodanese-like domain-containing protein [Lewinella sp. JB7]|uniref:rhodanese-like domain-containing protein n=1 Tax=Lewinella sp. JB7 TaxID=2962887 RepID=UPI0020C98E6F|nr:rhodanese-like domain-containing protein [Lewinella sp. JB7]MCP9237448.1 rhodanese-like domain-containing protein [Lewinella sp. JB7]